MSFAGSPIKIEENEPENHHRGPADNDPLHGLFLPLKENRADREQNRGSHTDRDQGWSNVSLLEKRTNDRRSKRDVSCSE